MDFLTDPIFSEFGRSDFIGGIDNEALDFGHLEQFIHVAAATGTTIQGDGIGGQDAAATSPNTTTSTATVGGCGSIVTQSHLPESPPDSGSEPPYSPADLQGLTLTTNSNNVSSSSGNGGGGGGGAGGGGGGSGVENTNQPVSNGSSNGNVQPITLNHSITTVVPQGHGNNIQQPGTPQQRGELSNDITTLTDISQTSIALSGVNDIHHHSHHTLLTNHNHHPSQQQPPPPPPPPQQQHALYLRSEQANEQQNVQNTSSITMRKHGDMLLAGHQADPQLILPQQPGVTTMLELERTYHNQQNLMSIGPTPINAEDLSRLMPEVYSTTHPTTPPISISTRTSLTPIHCRKRKLSQPDNNGPPIVKPEPGSSLSPICQQHLDPGSPVSTTLSNINSTLSIPETSLDGSVQNTDSTDPCPLQCIRFTPFQQQNWHVLCDQSLQELPVPHYRVDADKGFNFSNSDDAFVCQKKNHFQITCHAQLQGAATFVRTSSGLEKIKSFHLHFYGVKLEAPNQTIRVEQSQSDRSKKPFHPVPIDLQNRLVSKVTVGRLHFSETTSNNMRKKGRPNPEQRYFQLVVGLHAHTHSGHFPVVSQGSERIIVRASNPGQFESDVELCWQRGVTQDSIYHAGRVGINTDRPDESLVVHGNLKVSGHIVQPSDSRAKQEISELDTSQQLKNLQKIRVVKYRYEPEFAIHSGLKAKNDGEEIIDTGVIAQEVREVLPDAVQEAGSIVLPNGQVIENFLLVNKDRILMENIGAVKELCKVTGSLETRIEQLEKINSRLMRIQQLDRNHNCTTKKCKHVIDEYDESEEICSNKTIQLVIIVLVIIMAICLAAISTLYFVEHSKQRDRFYARYDRYDVSQFISHDAILINNDHNRNDYRTDRRQHNTQPNRKSNSILTSFTNRPHQTTTSIESPSPNSRDDQREVMTYRQLVIDKVSNNKIKANLNVNGIKWTSTSNDGDENPSSAETSSEKASDALLLPQDVENNSIDGETQRSNSNRNSKNSGSKSITPLHKQLNDSTQIESNKEIQQITNKSRADTEDTDLQYLSNTSDPEDQGLFEIGSIPILSKIIAIPPIGRPEHCENPSKEIVECQSVCCEETNNKLSMHLTDNEPTINNSFETDITQNGSTNRGNPLGDPPHVSDPSDNAEKALLKLIVNDEQPVEVKEIEPISDIDEIKQHKLNDAKRIVTPGSRSDKQSRECLPMTSWIRSESFNVSLGTETFCLNGGHNLNITYSVPLSKYMRETKIELHFGGSNMLQWTICSNKQRTTHGYIAKDVDNANTVNNGKVSLKNLNKSIFYLHLPNYGFFEHHAEFKASLDPVKNACQEQPDEASNLLQYNIRIFRDCD